MSNSRPGPSEAVHVTLGDSRRSLCGQSMADEPEKPTGTCVTCPSCADAAQRRDLDVNTDEF